MKTVLIYCVIDVDKRQKPIGHLKHKKFGLVPVIEINDGHIIWDDNQWSRTLPPSPQYEISDIDEFENTVLLERD